AGNHSPHRGLCGPPFPTHAGSWSLLTDALSSRKPMRSPLLLALPLLLSSLHAADPVILTPKPPAEPRINGPKVFGVRPASPFLYAIPATGERPMSFSAKGLPAGLKLDEATGRITGKLEGKGTHEVVLTAKNGKGSMERAFKIVAGDTIALT